MINATDQIPAEARTALRVIAASAYDARRISTPLQLRDRMISLMRDRLDEPLNDDPCGIATRFFAELTAGIPGPILNDAIAQISESTSYFD